MRVVLAKVCGGLEIHLQSILVLTPMSADDDPLPKRQIALSDAGDSIDDLIAEVEGVEPWGWRKHAIVVKLALAYEWQAALQNALNALLAKYGELLVTTDVKGTGSFRAYSDSIVGELVSELGLNE